MSTNRHRSQCKGSGTTQTSVKHQQQNTRESRKDHAKFVLGTMLCGTRKWLSITVCTHMPIEKSVLTIVELFEGIMLQIFLVSDGSLVVTYVDLTMLET